MVIPSKIRKNCNHRYAFVKFYSTQSLISAINHENGRRIGNYKLRVNPAKFDTPSHQLSANSGNKNQPSSTKPFPNPKPNQKPAMRDHRSYKEVSTHSHPYQNTSHPKPPTPKPSPSNTIQPNQLFEPIPEHFEKEISKLREESSKLLGQDTVKTRDQITLEDFDGEQLIAIKGKVSQENEELFSRSAIGIANSSSTSEVIHEHILAEGVNCLRVKPLGGMAHLIIFDSIEDKEAMIGSQWLLRWFNNIQNVHGDCTTQWRQAWITIYGVPLSAWSYENFFQIGNIYGRVLSVEYSRMDYAKVLIFTDCFFQINNPLIFTLEERKFKVFITEECTSYGCSKPITPAETSKAKMDHDGDKDASDISPFSEEDEQLDGSPIVNHFSSSENELVEK